MVNFCAVFGCSNKAKPKLGRSSVHITDSPVKSFFRLPKIVTNQGDRALELSAVRRRKWLASINRGDIKKYGHIRVCSDHFVTGL